MGQEALGRKGLVSIFQVPVEKFQTKLAAFGLTCQGVVAQRASDLGLQTNMSR